MCGSCSKLTIKTPEQRHRRHCSGVFIVDIEQVNASWEACLGPCQASGGAFLWKYQLPIFAKNHRGLTEF